MMIAAVGTRRKSVVSPAREANLHSQHSHERCQLDVTYDFKNPSNVSCTAAPQIS